MASDYQRPPLKNCPACGVAMVAEEAEDDPRLYTFRCLWCGLSMRYAATVGSNKDE
jgi:hypothetical protein